jgi:hypothetical protein
MTADASRGPTRGMRTLSAVLVASLVTACTTESGAIAAAPVSPLAYQGIDCPQLIGELGRIQTRATELGGRLDRAAQTDAALLGLSLVLFWPAAIFIGGKHADEAEYARLKGELDAVQRAIVARACPAASVAAVVEGAGAGAAAADGAAVGGPAATTAAAPGAGAAAAMPSFPPTVLAADLAVVPGILPEPALMAGARTLRLPPGTWVLASRRTVQVGTRLGSGTATTTNAPTIPAWQLLALRLDGTVVSAAVSMTVPKGAGGTLPAYWNVDACLSGEVEDRQVLRRDLAQPECASLRRVDTADEGFGPSPFDEAARFARRYGLDLGGRFREARYARYVSQGFVDVSVLLPERLLPTASAALPWMRSLAAALGPIAGRGGGSASLPMP